MTTIQTIDNGDSGLISRNKINSNDANLNADKLESVDLSSTPSAIKVTINNNAGTNADINLADVTNAGLLSPSEKSNIATNNAKVTNATHTGDVTGSTVLTIANDAVTNDKLDTMPTNSFKANPTAGVANPTDVVLGNSTFAGRTSSSNIKGLSVAEVKTELGAGLASGLATLDGGGQIPASQLPAGVVTLKGSWNAATNTPTLADGVGSAGDTYDVTVGGTQNLGSGSIIFDVKDQVRYGGAVYYKLDNTDAVNSVHGRTGVVISANGDYTGSQITNTPSGSLSATTAQAAINELETEKEPTFAKNTGFNKNLGTTAGTVAEGNDSRFGRPLTATQIAFGSGTNEVSSSADVTWNNSNKLIKVLGSANIGNGNFLGGNYSISVGNANSAGGVSSQAFGDSNVTSGDQAAAFGKSNQVAGSNAMAIGQNLIANAFASLILGRFNEDSGTSGSWVAAETIFAIGNGATNLLRSNIFEILKNGQTKIGGGAIDASLMFDVASTTKASRPNPPMTTTQKNAIPSPKIGFKVYDTTLNKDSTYNGISWDSGELPADVMQYKGSWNAATNTPTLADFTGNEGDVYRVNGAGTQNLGSGSVSYKNGDQVIYSNVLWLKSINSLPVLADTQISFGNASNEPIGSADLTWTAGNNELKVVGRVAIGSTSLAFQLAFDVQLVDPLIPKASRVWPPMTTALKNSIGFPQAGYGVFDTDLNAPSIYDGASWRQLAYV